MLVLFLPLYFLLFIFVTAFVFLTFLIWHIGLCYLLSLPFFCSFGSSAISFHPIRSCCSFLSAHNQNRISLLLDKNKMQDAKYLSSQDSPFRQCSFLTQRNETFILLSLASYPRPSLAHFSNILHP